MEASQKHSFSSILSVNPYKETYYKSVSSFVSAQEEPQYEKDQFVISYINSKEFINAQIEISKNIPEEDLFDAIYNKAYDELALDQAIEYKVDFVEIFNALDEENRHFNVFIVDPLDITNTFLPVVEKVKYIDVIIPSPLLLKALYTKEIIQSSNAHCFIYIQENDAFLVIYNNQEYTYTKSLKYSLHEMHERFCELYGERIDYEEFLNFYANVSLKTTQSEYKPYFIRLYKEIFSNVNDILTYAKRAFDIDKFEHTYISSNIDTITKLDEMLEVELSINCSEFNFDYGFENSDIFVDQLHSLMHLYAHIPHEEKYNCNFTVYERPPKFIKRDSGQFLLTLAASLVLAFIYPVSYWILTYTQELQKDLLQQDYKEVHNLRVTREATLKNRVAEKEKALVLLNREKQDYIAKKNTLIKIHKVKVDYPMKAKLIATLTKDLNRFGVQTQNITYGENNTTKELDIALVASHDSKITKLLAYITKIHEGKLNFKLEKIYYDEKLKKYFSELKVNLL